MKKLISVFLIMIMTSGRIMCTRPGVFCNYTECFAVSDDNYSDAQTSLSSDTDIDTDTPEGWDAFASLVTAPRTVIVAVIDTGVDYMHPDLADNMWVNTGEIPDNGIDDDGNGYIDDIYGWDFYNNDPTVCHYITDETTGALISDPSDCDDHGTHVAGIIAAVRNNGIGIAGIASCTDVKIMSLKIHGGPDMQGNTSAAAEAVKYAEMMGADICNLSWGTNFSDKNFRSTIKNSSMLFVTAAGNYGQDIDDSHIYPASYSLPNIITVTCTDENGALTPSSDYGAEAVDLGIPAAEIYSTVVGGGYKYMGGSSMAAPHVSGIAAVLYSYLGKTPPEHIADIICSSAKPVEALKDKTAHAGIASLQNALAYASQEKALEQKASAVTYPDYSLVKQYFDGKIRLSLTVTPGSSGVIQLRYLIGTQNTGFFKNGAGGLAVEDNTIILDKAGKYTIYCTDKNGFEFTRTYLITDDTLPPYFEKTDFSFSGDGSIITVSGTVHDLHSGIRRVKYLPGLHSAADFIGNAGTVTEYSDDGSFSFTVDSEGTYTVCATDMRGNRSVTVIRCYARHAVKVDAGRSRLKLKAGKTHTLEPSTLPAQTTDTLTYASSDVNIVKVSGTGVITAKKAGKAVITVTASSGASDTVKITVK